MRANREYRQVVTALSPPACHQFSRSCSRWKNRCRSSSLEPHRVLPTLGNAGGGGRAARVLGIPLCKTLPLRHTCRRRPSGQTGCASLVRTAASGGGSNNRPPAEIHLSD